MVILLFQTFTVEELQMGAAETRTHIMSEINSKWGTYEGVINTLNTANFTPVVDAFAALTDDSFIIDLDDDQLENKEAVVLGKLRAMSVLVNQIMYNNRGQYSIELRACRDNLNKLKRFSSSYISWLEQ
jgi:hypothetical protein